MNKAAKEYSKNQQLTKLVTQKPQKVNNSTIKNDSSLSNLQESKSQIFENNNKENQDKKNIMPQKNIIKTKNKPDNNVPPRPQTSQPYKNNINQQKSVPQNNNNFTQNSFKKNKSLQKSDSVSKFNNSQKKEKQQDTSSLNSSTDFIQQKKLEYLKKNNIIDNKSNIHNSGQKSDIFGKDFDDISIISGNFSQMQGQSFMNQGKEDIQEYQNQKQMKNLELLRNLLLQQQFINSHLKQSQLQQQNHINNQFYDRVLQCKEIIEENTLLQLRILKMEVIKSLEDILYVEYPTCKIIFEKIDYFTENINNLNEYLNGCIRKVYLGEGLIINTEEVNNLIEQSNILMEQINDKHSQFFDEYKKISLEFNDIFSDLQIQNQKLQNLNNLIQQNSSQFTDNLIGQSEQIQQQRIQSLMEFLD